MWNVRVFVAAFLFAIQAAQAGEIRHRFLAVGESRNQLLYVDQTNPAKDWTFQLPGKHRDIQLVGNNVVMLTHADGYREYRLGDRSVVKEAKGYPGATSARRLPDGRTVLTCNREGVIVFELDRDDTLVRKASFQAPSTRVLRLTPQGTFLFGSSNTLYEGDWSGKVLRTIVLKKGSWVYQALWLPGGHVLAAGGYDSTLIEFDSKGTAVRTIGGADKPETKTLGYHFFGAFQVLPSGNLVICNWTGHGVDDGTKGVQIVEYNPAGQLVWKWHDPVRAGSINGVIILDGHDTSLLYDDTPSAPIPPKWSD